MHVPGSVNTKTGKRYLRDGYAPGRSTTTWRWSTSSTLSTWRRAGAAAEPDARTPRPADRAALWRPPQPAGSVPADHPGRLPAARAAAGAAVAAGRRSGCASPDAFVWLRLYQKVRSLTPHLPEILRSVDEQVAFHAGLLTAAEATPIGERFTYQGHSYEPST